MHPVSSLSVPFSSEFRLLSGGQWFWVALKIGIKCVSSSVRVFILSELATSFWLFTMFVNRSDSMRDDSPGFRWNKDATRILEAEVVSL